MNVDEVIVAKLKERVEDTHLSEPALENCENCDRLMPEGCIGWCPRCDKGMKHDPYLDLIDAGGIFHVRCATFV